MHLSDEEKNYGRRNFHSEAVFQAVFYIAKSAILLDFARLNGFSDLQLSLLSTVYTFGGIVALPASYFYEKGKSGKKFMMVWSAAGFSLFALAILVMAFKNHIACANWLFLILTLCSLAATTLSSTPSLIWHGQLVERKEWGTYMGRRLVYWNVSEVLSYLLLCAMVRYFTNSLGMQMPGYFLAFAIATLSGFITLYFISNIPELVKLPRENLNFFRNILLPPLKRSNFRIFLCSEFLFNFGMAFYIPCVNLMLLKDLSVDVFTLSIYSSLSAVIGISLYGALGKLSDKIGNRVLYRTALMAFFLLPFTWLAIYFMKGGLAFLPFLILNSYGELGIFGAAYLLSVIGLRVSLTPELSKSSFISMSSFVAALGCFSGAITAGKIREALPDKTQLFGLELSSYLAVLMISSIFMLACFALSFLFREKKRHPSKKSQEMPG
ncbi:MAG: hypothetical protein A2X49_16235 [Lentisphaerae bacterium GWF2_52_8]|nr:MAG: hypothetical protein A2X49_16235 [Lentisphaerae bacterium GWF2_52_8]